MTEITEYLREKAQDALGRPLTGPEQAKAFKYLDLLRKWQKSQRLVGSGEPRWLVDNIIADSLLFARVLPPGVSSICDVGSGAGVPGIPLKIVMPTVEVVFLESRERRASFLAAAIREIPLAGCRVVNERLEHAAVELAGRFDAVVMRCAGSTESLLAQVRSLLVSSGVAVISGPPARSAPRAGETIRDDAEYVEVSANDRVRRFRIHRNASHAT